MILKNPRKEWKTVPLGKIAKVGAGNSAPQKKELFQNGIYPFVRTSDVGKIRVGSISDSADKLNEKGIAKLRLVPKGTILAPKSGASTFLNHRVILECDSYVSSHLATIKADPEYVLDAYLHYFLLTVKAQDLIQDHKYPSLKLSDIESICVSMPSLPEQKHIVAILDEAFTGIATAVANTEKNLVNARELFEGYLNSVFSQRSEGWEETRLSDCAISVSTGPFGSLLHKSDYVPDGVPLVNPVNIIGSEIVPDENKLISDKTKERLQAYILRKGDIIIARRGEIGRCAVINEEQDGWVCGTGCFFIRPRPVVNSYFLASMIRSDIYRTELERQSTGTTMKNISNKTLSNLSIVLPKKAEQEIVVKKLAELSEQSHSLESIYQCKLTALAELKQSLLQKAFSGQWIMDN